MVGGDVGAGEGEMVLKYGFYSVHKSHFINLQLIGKNQSDGIVIIRDKAQVPVERRLWEAFVKKVLQQRFLVFYF